MMLDSWAWMELLSGRGRAPDVARFVDEIPTIATCPVVVAEVYSQLHRRHSEAVARRAAVSVLEECVMVPHDEAQGLEAGRIHAELKGKRQGFGMADALVLAAARSRKLKVLTGDPHFRGLPDAVLL